MYQGDILDDQVIDLMFNTAVNGQLTTLSGTPVVRVYKDNSTTQHTSTFSVTADFDGLTGLNHVRITTTNAFFATGSTYHIVIDTGTLGGINVQGYVVGSFTIEHRKVILGNKTHGGAAATLSLESVVISSASDAVTIQSSGSRALVIETTGGTSPAIFVDSIGSNGIAIDSQVAAGLYVDGDSAGAIFAGPFLQGLCVGGIDAYPLDPLAVLMLASERGTAQAGGTNTITLRSGASSTTDFYKYQSIVITGGTGVGQVGRATGYDGTTKVLTISENWVVQPDNTSTYLLLGRIE